MICKVFFFRVNEEKRLRVMYLPGSRFSDLRPVYRACRLSNSRISITRRVMRGCDEKIL